MDEWWCAGTMSLCLQGIEELNRQIRLFKQNYLVVEVESLLLDTATKLEWIVRQGITVGHMTLGRDVQLC